MPLRSAQDELAQDLVGLPQFTDLPPQHLHLVRHLVGPPPRVPLSTAALFTHSCSVCGTQPIFSTIDTKVTDPYRTLANLGRKLVRRLARMALSSQQLEPPTNPKRFRHGHTPRLHHRTPRIMGARQDAPGDAGTSYAKSGKSRLGCQGAAKKGPTWCGNRLTIRQVGTRHARACGVGDRNAARRRRPSVSC